MEPSQFEKIFSRADSITGPFADSLLQQAKFPPSTNSALVVLDMACGSGVVSSHIMALLSSEAKSRLDLTCADTSDAMISNLTRRIEALGWKNTRAVIADAMVRQYQPDSLHLTLTMDVQDTKFPSSHFSHIFFNFGPMILPNGLVGLRECHRILQPNGVLGFTTWQTVPWFIDYRAGIAMNPSLPSFPSDDRLKHAFSEAPERWDSVEDLRSHFEATGFDEVEVRVAECTTKYKLGEMEDMMPYTLGMMIQKFWTKEELEKYQGPAGEAILEYLKLKYSSGPIVWNWVGFVATGRKA
ncbi:uncharacterized protein Z518_06291 [Rhinocladiella mackenziei CBS 650.93]|uniref:Methyltransferase type 11 domain-containing protein n=1 Tax=Rhinocladiella mackenziei CBS 650.93 TaxID=1442369 RepID=A0A0D2II37_9EURO|nr:uncharacterized protein Z518_06291 [Rhinocladiella mackenziei CBS 650.93]KIX05419.1 hypothetical protein Z518_06291 [Rhinocladiella mackenziei CBS 650.93]